MISTYAELQSAVIFEANRSDMADKVPLYIALAEKDLERMLVGSWLLHKSAQINLTANAGTIVLPSDLMRLESASYQNGSVIKIVDQSTSVSWYEKKNEYASIVGKTLVLMAASASAQTVNLVYKSKIIPLSGIVTENDVLKELWDAYLFASVGHLFRSLMDKQSSDDYMARAKYCVESFMEINKYAGTENQVIMDGVV